MSARQPWGLMPTIVVALLLVGGGFALYATGVMNPGGVPADDLTRVLIVAASPDDGGASVGQIIVEVELTADGVEVTPVSPALSVTIPGTSFSTLADAYPFGGGSGTARALARARGEDELPYVALDAAQLSAAIEGAGRVRLDLPVPMSVFDGERLYTFQEGDQALTSVEVQAVLKGARYLSAAERDRLDGELAEALVRVLGENPAVLDGASTDLSSEALARLKGALGR